MDDGLRDQRLTTDKQEMFISFYLGEARFNATQAAKMAGYSEHSAQVIGSETLSKPHIRSRIDEYLNTPSRMKGYARVQ